MSENSNSDIAKVEHLPSQKPARISDELAKVLSMVREHAPKDAKVSIDFDGKLHLHVDVRNGEDVKVLEKFLPQLGAGVFHDIEVGSTPHHPFFHRVSALIDR
ncbi:hypothetical protein GCM10011349_24390 [Novosphingobium indicum]|uniref:Uncharacterized protein n=1 Tax=Novosphingobium indicum TaxID=462949 RepID=A0ABQ2JPH9_9SPHN|nr:hypothetical protein [Novosphingobium indicum]GGN51642.1 hypothetical protein GCM10011349_24390 [Novosphingobium indicum]